jgi:hypothetical protein
MTTGGHFSEARVRHLPSLHLLIATAVTHLLGGLNRSFLEGPTERLHLLHVRGPFGEPLIECSRNLTNACT